MSSDREQKLKIIDEAIASIEKTYGKGSVQDFETYPDGSGLKLTVAEWYTPGGRNINILLDHKSHGCAKNNNHIPAYYN